MSFKQVAISLNGKPLKPIVQFIYLSSSISSTESDANICIRKAGTAIDILSVIQKSDLSHKIKRQFLQSCSRVGTIVWMHYLNCNETHGEKAWWKLQKNAAWFWKIPGSSTLQNSSWMAGYISLILQTIKVRWIRHADHCWGNNDELKSDIFLRISTHWHKSFDWPAKTYINCMDTGCSVEDLPGVMDNKEWWRESKDFMSLAQLAVAAGDDDPSQMPIIYAQFFGLK